MTDCIQVTKPLNCRGVEKHVSHAAETLERKLPKHLPVVEKHWHGFWLYHHPKNNTEVHYGPTMAQAVKLSLRASLIWVCFEMGFLFLPLSLSVIFRKHCPKKGILGRGAKAVFQGDQVLFKHNPFPTMEQSIHLIARFKQNQPGACHSVGVGQN